MPDRSLVSAALLAAACGLSAPHADAQSSTLLLRFPDVSDSQVAFVHAGDIYVAPREGGVARQLTSGEGLELFPKFSPDGRWIAYSAEYTGTRQVWVIPAGGGLPRQLTWYNDVGPLPLRGGWDNRVLDWTPDGKHVLVRMNRIGVDERGGRYYQVPVDGGMETPLEIPEGGGASLSPDGSKLAYTPIDSDWRGWKRYRGGRAQDVWVYDLKASTSVQLTTDRAQDMQPVWLGEDIYFASDRAYTMNLYRLSPAGGEPEKVTDFKDFDVLWPSGGRDALVFENGGAIWMYQPGGEAHKIEIALSSDRPARLPAFRNVAADIESFAVSNKGERALVAARGELFSVPAKNGEIRNLSHSPTAREHSLTLSPDGKQALYLSDATGEYEFWVRSTDGSGKPRQVTRDGDVWRFPPVFAHGGERFAYADKKLRLRVVELESGRTREVDRIHIGNEITDYVFSPDGNVLAYSLTDASGLGGIWAFDLRDGRKVRLTSPQFGASNPAFDPKGRWLYFLSRRDHNLQFSDYEFNYVYSNNVRIYAAALSNQGLALDALKSDEIGAELPKAAEWDGKGPLRFDLDQVDQRAVPLKLGPGNYGQLAANGNYLFYVSTTGAGQELKAYDLGTDKEETVLKGVQGYALSDNGEKLAFRIGQGLGIADAKPGQDAGKTLDLAKFELRVDPAIEWQQMYVDTWRILRDWFYDEGVHGNDWNAIRAKYEPLVKQVANREDLDYLLHELAGELNAGHVYVERGANRPNPVARRDGGLLGAEISATDYGFFRIDKIYAGQNWSDDFRSPLTAAGVKVQAGDYIVAVDGTSTREVKNFYALLENKGNRVVELLVNDRPDLDGARLVRVRTITSETGLRYLDWVESRRQLVDKLSAGRIGYVHLPNTAVEGNRELVKQMLWQTGKEALVIDDRYNGGGFIPDRMIEILARRPLNYWKRRGLDPQATPLFSHDGPKAMLINGLSSSGGDALPYYFRKLNLGPLIGTRTWGGLIGISGNPGLADGSQILAATFRFMDTDNRWAVENEGVAPDIEVQDRPELVAKGRDPGVEKAVEVLLKTLDEHPRTPVQAPPAPREFGRPQ